MKKSVFFILFISLGLFSSIDLFGCTSIIVSGRASKDGRPFIMKNRDTDGMNNLAILIQGKKYKYIGIVGARDKKPHDVWSGHNEKGFAILNTAAYNLNGGDKRDDNDGVIMRLALESCATLKDFEHLLDTLPKPLLANSNYGVLDAEGGCAYYETGHQGYVKFDANDPKVAPYGYIARTNHGMSGERKLDEGLERYISITDYMLRAGYAGPFDFRKILTEVPRYLIHGVTGVNLNELMPPTINDSKIVDFNNFIPRYITASVMLVQGVKQGEDPSLTVSWTIVGNPLTTVAVPLMIASGVSLPEVVTRGKEGYSELCHDGLELKSRLFALSRGNNGSYIDVAKLLNKEGTGILQRIRPIEKTILDKGQSLIQQMYQEGRPSKKLVEYYQWVDQYVRDEYATILKEFP